MKKLKIFQITFILIITSSKFFGQDNFCLLYTSDAADERSSVDLGGRRIIKKKKIENNRVWGAE